jgi:outer membrane protein TolC
METVDPTAKGGLRLDQAVKLALSKNERARISDLNVVVADAAVQKATAAFLPVISLGGTDTIRPKRTQNGTETQMPNVATGTGSVSQPILVASNFPLLAQAKNNRDATIAQTVDDKRTLAFDAARAFFAVLSAQAVLEASQRAYDTAKDNLSDTQARVDAQLNSSNDATRAQIDLASSARQVEVNRGTVQNAFTTLAFTINAQIDNQVTVPEELLHASERPLAPVESLVKFALGHRPDVDAKKLAAVAAHDFADEPLLRLVPTIGATASAQAVSDPGTSSPYLDESLVFTANWTLFDNGTRYADRRSRVATAQIADLTTVTLVRSVDAQVKTAFASLTSAQAAFRVAQQGFQAAKQSSEETAILYREGLAKAIELVDANDSRLTAEVEYVSAEYAMAQAYLDMRQALGEGPLGTELK